MPYHRCHVCTHCEDCVDMTPDKVACALCGEERTQNRLSDGLCRDCRREAEKKLADFLRGLSRNEVDHIDSVTDGSYLVDWLEEYESKAEPLKAAVGM